MSEVCPFSSAFQINILFGVSILPSCYMFVNLIVVLCIVLVTAYVEYKLTLSLLFNFLVSPRLPCVYTKSPRFFVAPNVMFCISCLVFPAFPLPFASNMLVTGRPRPTGRGAKRGRPRGSRRGFISTRGRGITVNLTNSDLGLGKSMSYD